EDRLWQPVAVHDPEGSLSCRSLFSSAMALCEARRDADRLSRRYELAARFQDRDAASPTWGNLRWYWRDAQVTDQNAVEFCMQDALLTWIFHRQWMPEPARQRLRELMALGLEGCLRHRVRPGYTNIALLNAANLIGLGEVSDRPDAAEEGYRRLGLACLWTWRCGVCEYCSPTYYGVDLQGIHFIQQHAQREPGRRQAEALARLFWTDIAANWFPPAQRLAGAHSRTYDYLGGLGSLDPYLQASGWIDGPIVPGPAMIHPLRSPPTPPNFLQGDAALPLPRLVRQSWGPSALQSRTHMLYPDLTLSSAAANYGAHDMPLTIDLPGARGAVRGYFIPDGREDPYGKLKYATGSAGHQKALHLKTFWTAAQRTCDAVGLVVYRPQDLQEEVVANLQSHFVLRRQHDGAWIGGRPIALAGDPGKPGRAPLEVGQPLVIRYGTAAVGIRVLWARAQDSTPPVIALVDDGNRFGAIRLTIEHHRQTVSAQAGAALWVRVGSGLADEDRFRAWRSAFEAAGPGVAIATEDQIRIEVPGAEGPVSLSAAPPFDDQSPVELVPAPGRVVLQVCGAGQQDSPDVGRQLLEQVEPIRTYCRQRAQLRPVAVPADGEATWEAEDGIVFPEMELGEDPRASGGRFVGSSKESQASTRTGSVTFELEVAEAGTYYLWGRVLAPDPERDSFYVVLSDGFDPAPNSASWHTLHDPEWQWRPVAFDRAKTPARFELGAGRTPLQFRVREPGAKLDRLVLTRDPNYIPEQP
ncbi:MAG: hypothetical protein ACYC6Y_10270, partial [Thermoguttaceae bacterium]